VFKAALLALFSGLAPTLVLRLKSFKFIFGSVGCG
jgi:hypothetical protein